MNICFLLTLLIIIGAINICKPEAFRITSSNLDQILQETDVMLVNFYADWCRFSQILAPEFDGAADEIRKEFPDSRTVKLAKIDCDAENGIAARYRVNKYPTIKLFRLGEMTKKEFRGRRTKDQILEYIREQVKDPKIYVDSQDSIENLDRKKRNIILYIDQAIGPDYESFNKVASSLRDDCQFIVAAGDTWLNERAAGNRVVYRPNDDHHSDIPFAGTISDYQTLSHWSIDKCIPLVRDITFQNAEELTEEGLPFVILFYDTNDKITPDLFRKQVSQHLLAEKSSVNFLIADGKQFTHPLHHLGKTEKDLPVLAIDSFRHMYPFTNGDLQSALKQENTIKQFIADLHSGKLHREFHNGPDPTEPPIVSNESNENKEEKIEHIPKTKEENVIVEQAKKRTSPPESTFKKLAPSRNRYTILKDEL